MITDEYRDPGEVARENIITMIREANLYGEKAGDFVLLVSNKDSSSLEKYLERGFLGSSLRDDYFVKGLLTTLPRFLGFMTIWWAQEETVFKSLLELSSKQLVKLVEAQGRIIKDLWEHRQRL
jgi:hypothetical protein